MKTEEHHHQCALIEWARLQANTIPALSMLYAIPNGGHRHIATARKLKSEGVVAGVPDLCLAWASGKYFGLYIEMKSKKGVLSYAQKDWLASLNNAGYAVAVCRSFDEAKKTIEEYLDG